MSLKFCMYVHMLAYTENGIKKEIENLPYDVSNISRYMCPIDFNLDNKPAGTETPSSSTSCTIRVELRYP